MKILMISIDKGLLGQGQLGDVVERHKKYGSFCDRLDIIVLSKRGFNKKQISDRVTIYPTNSSTRWGYFSDVCKIGKKLFSQTKYDLIVSEFFGSLPAYKLKKKYKTKLLLNLHGDFFNNKQGLEGLWTNYVLLLINNFIIKKIDGIRVVSNGIKQKLIQKGIEAKKIKVISTPINLDKFLNQEKVEKEKSEKVILFVGRLESVKNLEWFIKEVFTRVGTRHGVFFKIAGTGSQENKLKKIVKDLNLENLVKFLGQTNQEETIKYLNNCDVFVLPSRSESFGKVLVEANACGKPVVATMTTGAKEIVQDGVNGCLIPIGNAKKMVEKILYLLNNSDKAKEMGEAGKKMMQEKYSNNIQKIVKFWEEIIK